MHLVIQRKRLYLRPGVWISEEEIVRRARAVALWPRSTVYLEWGGGGCLEPIRTEVELRFAARLVAAHHGQSVVYYDDTGDVEAETAAMEAAAALRMEEPDSEPEDVEVLTEDQDLTDDILEQAGCRRFFAY